jgi:hypothetical protein
MIDSLSFSPRKMWHWLYGATKSPAISPPICGSTLLKRWQGNIWPLVLRTSGQMNVSMWWTGNTWTLPSRTRQICTKYGGLNNIWAFVVPSLTPKSVPAGTKLVLFGRYILNIYIGIVRYFLHKTKTQRAKIHLPTQCTNRRISYDIN